VADITNRLLVTDIDRSLPPCIPYFQAVEDSFQSGIRSGENVEYSTDGHQEGGSPYPHMSSMSPVKLMRRVSYQMLLLVFPTYVLCT
jgi:hypothetical protein